MFLIGHGLLQKKGIRMATMKRDRNRVRLRGAARAATRRVFGLTVMVVVFLTVCVLAGCVDASVDPSRISARVVSAGVYSLREGSPDFVESRTNISCEVGLLFGVGYALEVAGGASGVLPVQFKWIHPAIPVEGSSRVGTETEGGVSNPVMERGRVQLLGRSLWSIDSANDQVPGIYRFEIRTVGDNQILLSHDFDIGGC